MRGILKQADEPVDEDALLAAETLRDLLLRGNDHRVDLGALDGRSVRDLAALLSLGRPGMFSNRYGDLARAITPGMRAVTPDQTRLIGAVADILVYLYGRTALLADVGQYAIPLDHLLGWLELLAERAPDAAAPVFERLAQEGYLAAALAVCRGAFPHRPSDGYDLLLLLLGARKPAPSTAWLERCQALRARLDEPALSAALLELTRVPIDAWGPQEGDPRMIVARGALWALGDFPDDETRDYLAATVLTWARSGNGTPMLGNAAVWALARAADAEAVRRLLDLKQRIKHKNLRARTEEALAGLAAASGLSPDEVADRQVPDHCLDRSGSRTWQLGGHTVTLSLPPSGGVQRTIRDAVGREVRAVPAIVRESHAGTWKEITQEGKVIAATLSAQRARLEEAMIAGRTWTLATWQETIGAHPFLSSLARRLVWQVQAPAPATVMPDEDGQWRDVSRQMVTVSPDGLLAVAHPLTMPDGLLAVAHPLTMPDGDQTAWRQRIVAARLVQPFKQIFRETYVVTPAEEAAGNVSSRFAGMPVALGQIYALTKSRGWSGPLGQTGFDGAGVGRREFPAQGVRAILQHDFGPGFVAEVETVSFERRVEPKRGKRPTWEPMPLRDVPPVVFSEAMRDVDLVVSVAAIGTEAQWRAWEAQRAAGQVRWADQQAAYERHWTELSAGRAAVLGQLLPLLNLADRVTIEGRFVHVRGRCGRYRIHLASGNVHLEPDGRYLCIVASRRGDALYLPSEGEDDRISEILSKVVLLAHDDTIKDRSILRQLPWGMPEKA
jgi:hypothetical protein